MMLWIFVGLQGMMIVALGNPEGESLIEKLKDDRNVREGKQTISWGLQDTMAVIGRLFEYRLPKITISDQVTQYTVTEAGMDQLPTWLHFNASGSLMEGVPSSTDAERLYYIEVTVRSHWKNEPSSVSDVSKDIFVIHVKEDVIFSVGNNAKPLKDFHGNGSSPKTCNVGSAVTMATVIIDADFETMSGQVRSKTIRDFARQLDMPVESLRMLGSGVARQQLDSTALVAGPGNIVKPLHSKGVLIQWVVGCGSVTNRHMKILQSLEVKARDGSLANAIGIGITGWHVTNSRGTMTMRQKRLVPHPTATPQPTLRPPTGHPTATMVVHPVDGPQTRIIPSFGSPTLAFTSERPHRTKTKGRHHGKTKHTKHHTTATKYPGEWQSRNPIDGFAIPTPSPVYPVMPTQSPVIDLSTNVLIPTPPDVLEPSLVFPVVSLATTHTKTLSTSTHVAIIDAATTTSWRPPVGGRTPDLPMTTERTPALPATVPSPTDDFNYAPYQKNDIDQLTVVVGEVFRFVVPNDTFFDYEDGWTRKLKLLFLTVDRLSMTPNSWIKFNETTQTLYGMPLEEHAGKQDYVLVAKDSGDRQTSDSFEIVIQRRFLERKINHQVVVCLDVDYNIFMMDVDLRVDVAEKIAHALGDDDTSKMAVMRISEGSVEFSWTNLSLAGVDPCPVDALNQLTENMIMPDNTLNPYFVESLRPHEVLSVEFTPKGASCSSRMSLRKGGRPQDSMTTSSDVDIDAETKPKMAGSMDGLIVTTIIPIFILGLILAFALVLLCAICSRKKKGDGCDSNQTARKGVPVIFADELEEKPNIPTKPLILTEEKPPVAPPDYDQATVSNSPSTPRSCCNDPLIPGHENGSAVQRSNKHPNQPYVSLYSAQAGGGTGGTRRSGSGRPQMQQQQMSRNPPPYVPS